MPILNDIMDHQVLGPVFRQGMEEGRKEMSDRFMRVIKDRFGALPDAIQARLAALSPEEWTAVLGRFPDASSVEDLFPPRSH
jgi:hypothetical protein